MLTSDSENELSRRINHALALGIPPESIGAALMAEVGMEIDRTAADSLEELITSRMRREK